MKQLPLALALIAPCWDSGAASGTAGAGCFGTPSLLAPSFFASIQSLPSGIVQMK
jgi:hypothetical protein